jgi:hypothetical protein
MKTIEIVISPTGETKLETRGFAGAECLAATRELEAALGRKAAERLSAEYFQTTSHSAQQRLAAGDNSS